jgi:threonine/homoserine/homoserine lactone efflux protein
MEQNTLLLFLFSSVLLTLAPGPDILFVISTSFGKGWRDGIKLAFGLTSGILIHTLVIVLGMGSILEYYPEVIRFIEIIGGIYLIYLAINTWRLSNQSQTENNLETVSQNLFITGLIMNLSNPKVSLFFLSFFSGFLFHDSWSYSLQFSFLGVIFYFQALIVFCLCSVLVDKLIGKVTIPIFWNKIQSIILFIVAIIIIYP